MCGLSYCLAEKGKDYLTIGQVFKYCVKLGVTCVCTLSSSAPCNDVTILNKNPTNALYILTTLYSHCYSPTCFRPQGANHRQC